MHSAAGDCNTSVFNGRGGRRRCTNPVENTYPLPSGSPAVHRPYPCDVLATQPSEDPCLRAFENQTRMIGWPGYAHDVKLGETNLGGAGGEVAGVPALGAGCSSAQCQCQSCLCAEGEGEPRATGHGGSFQGCYLKPRCSSHTFHPLLFLPRFHSSTVTINSCPPSPRLRWQFNAFFLILRAPFV